MDVHIVCKEPDETRIIRRLATTLAQVTGWSMSAQVRPDAAVNYFFPYLDLSACTTPAAAWFTHRDDAHDNKVRLWNHAAQSVELRLTSARLYADGLAQFGPTDLVPPPIDRRLFQPLSPGAWHDAVLTRDIDANIGVSGYSYSDGRKGEDLIKRLVRDLPALHWRLIGRGWGGKTERIAGDQLHEWYQTLGLYVCASRIEGVPMTVLEALACGVPVVIPRAVGLLDELPEDRRIYRYEAGNYDALRVAVESAVLDLKQHPIEDAERFLLHSYTAAYTALTWGAAHEAAFERTFAPLDDAADLPDWHGRAGIYCVAFGAPARACAQRLLESCARYMPDVETMLVSTAPLGPETHFQQTDDYDIGGRKAKLSIDRLAPAHWDYVLYLDADTELIAPVPHFFDVLQAGYELTICTNPGKYHTTRMMVRPDNRQEVDETFAIMGHDDLLQFNGGVFAFRRSARTRAFFERWLAEWMQYAKRDQAALLRALWAVPLRLYTLTNVWNTMDAYNDPATSAGVLHHQQEARRVSGIVDLRGDDPAAFKRIVK